MVEVLKPQIIPFGDGNEAGLELLQNDIGNGQLPYAFAPNDPFNALFNPRPENKLTFGVKNNYCTTTNCADLPEADHDGDQQ